MLFTDTTFIGIDIPGVRRQLVYAALDNNLDLIALSRGTADDVLAFVKGQDKVFVAVNSPRRTNSGFMAEEDFRAGLQPQPRPGRWDRWRVAEYELRLHRIKVRRTPADPGNAPGWMHIGFDIFQSLEASGFRPYDSAYTPPAVGSEAQPRYSIESYPHASFTALLECLPFPKTTLEGRIQRQLVLLRQDVEVPDPMQIFEEITRFRLLNGELNLDRLLDSPQLDALVAAYTAWSASTGDVTLLGHEQEGQIAIPVRELLAVYSRSKASQRRPVTS